MANQVAPGDGRLYAPRTRVYPRAVHGPARRVKWAVLIFCLTVYYALPWIRWDRGPGRPRQAVLLDIAHERFFFFGLEFWPQDIFYLTGLLIMAAVALFLVTSLFGRIWCGYACPQTVWTDLFMWVERAIEGDRNERMKRDAAPATVDKVWRKAAKHTAWLGVAFWTGGAWIMYYADAPTITVAFWSGTASTEVYAFTLIFTATTYLLAGWAREQVCTYMCPWPRFQSAMLDERSYTVTYRAWRGEPRTRGKPAVTAALDSGDCIDCGACVTACPTGIDIRDGIQLECINCGLCTDACDHVMARTGRPLKLIAWDTLVNQTVGASGMREPFRFWRPRTVLYLTALCLASATMTGALAMRPFLELSVSHDRAPLFVPLASGDIRNGYVVKIVNKTPEAADFEVSVTGLPAGILAEASVASPHDGGLRLSVAGDSVGTFRILLTGRSPDRTDGSLPVDFAVRNLTTNERARYRTVFMSPVRRQ